MKNGEFGFTSSEAYKDPEFKYTILKSHPNLYGKDAPEAMRNRTDEEMRFNYLRNTLDIISSVIEQDSDAVVFLDKSSRPVSWLFRELWKKYVPKVYPDEASRPKMPRILYSNIDKEQWEHLLSEGTVDESVILDEKIDEADLEELRETYNVSKDYNLNDRKIFIVDEVRDSGKTLDLAVTLFKKAFPSSKIDSAHWTYFATRLGNGQVMANGEIPVWYSPRGLMNHYYSGIANKAGHTFLSSRREMPSEEDPGYADEMKSLDTSNVLRNEMKKIVEEFMEKKGRFGALYDHFVQTGKL